MNKELLSFTGRYFAVWGLVLPISSILLIPALQGTTPSYCLAFLIIPISLVIGRADAFPFLSGIAKAMAALILLSLLGQLAIAVAGIPPLSPLVLTRSSDTAVVLRSTLFTQSLYLISVFSMFFFARYFYIPSWDPYILSGAVILAVYGLYELAYYSATGRPGDFLTNRTFGDGTGSGSLFELFAIGGTTFERLKSLTGEPSMYALTVCPYWIYALRTGYRKTAYLLFSTLVLTTSTTALLAMLVFLISTAYYKKSVKVLVVGLGSVFLIGVAGWIYMRSFIESTLIQKLTLENESGIDRYANFVSSIGYWWRSPWPTKLLGIGFGTIRSTDFFSTLLVNTGVVGVIVVSWIFIYPLFRLADSEYEIGLKQVCLVCFVILMVSVPEFSYLPTWLFLGIAYKYCWRMQAILANPIRRSLPATVEAQSSPFPGADTFRRVDETNARS